MAEIAVHALAKTYRGQIQALRGVSFEVGAGEVFGLLGPNGAGKSTLVRILATLSRPTAGSAQVAGHDVAEEPAAVRRAIGYVAQASACDQQLTGHENLILQGRLFGLSGSANSDRVDELLTLLGLEDAAHRLTRGYSGGMRRRLDLAMGLIHRPRILFLDEPSAGLDPESRAVLWREVERLVSEEGITVLLTTHYLEEADRLARRVAIIDKGEIVAADTPGALKSRLDGDMVTVALKDGNAAAAAAEKLGGLDPVRETIVEGSRVHVRSPDGAKLVPTVIAALDGMALEGVTLSRPSLDDVYLALTGKSFEKTHAAAEPSVKGRAA